MIIPVFNEAANLSQTLASIQPQQAIEIIVVDGGSNDDTVEIARSLGVKVLHSTRGRAVQMNAGALSATSEILLFLHADTRLPVNFDTMIRQSLNTTDCRRPIAGAFAIKIDASLPSLRLNWRSRWLQMPYGDQAIFVWSSVFHKMGGFPDFPIMEDLALMWRLKHLGKIAIVATPVVTSARRWLRLGVWQTTMINQLAIFAYFLGIPPQQIAQWYHRKSSDDINLHLR